MTPAPDPLRTFLAHLLDWEEAHVGFDKAVRGIPPELRGARPDGFTHSAWQLLEHLRLGQKDLLAFCADANYVHELTWPDDYWPRDPAPPTAAAWDQSVADFVADRARLTHLIQDPQVDLMAPVPTGKATHTYVRAYLLVMDHNAYHVGQLVALRQALRIWP